MEILSIQVAKPENHEWQGKTVYTSIFKKRVDGPIHVSFSCLQGDGQGDLKHHGGEFMAVYGFAHDAYAFFRKELGMNSIDMGAFGENLTFSELDESKLCIGDELALGDCRLQVIQPRLPCSRLNLRFGNPQMVKIFTEGNRPGIYFRVLKEGEIEKGDTAEVVEREPHRVPVQTLFDLIQKRKIDPSLLNKTLQVPVLPDDWKQRIQNSLAG